MLFASVGALMIAAAFALILIRPTAGGDTDPLGSAAAEHSSFHPPVRLPANGEYVRTRVLSSGEVRVEHWIRSAYPIYRVTLSVPAALHAQGETAFAAGVRVRGDHEQLLGASRIGSLPESYLPSGTSTLRITYVLSGALVRTGPTPGRALLRGTSLDVEFDKERGTRMVAVTGARVLGAACSLSKQDTFAARPCGTADGQSWQVRLGPRARHDTVLAQLDLT